MPRILITSGPTREYLDPVRYLTNASSGRMGAALAAAIVEAGHQAVIVSGPVDVEYPPEAEVHRVVSTEELLEACRRLFPDCDGMIAAAAPCDYRPPSVAPQKIHKTGCPLRMEMVETPDVVATLAADKKETQWVVAFALETEDPLKSALEKMRRKRCDMIVVNGPSAMQSSDTEVELLQRGGRRPGCKPGDDSMPGHDPAYCSLGRFSGDKSEVAREIINVINQQLIS